MTSIHSSLVLDWRMPWSRRAWSMMPRRNASSSSWGPGGLPVILTRASNRPGMRPTSRAQWWASSSAISPRRTSSASSAADRRTSGTLDRPHAWYLATFPAWTAPAMENSASGRVRRPRRKSVWRPGATMGARWSFSSWGQSGSASRSPNMVWPCSASFFSHRSMAASVAARRTAASGPATAARARVWVSANRSARRAATRPFASSVIRATGRGGRPPGRPPGSGRR